MDKLAIDWADLSLDPKWYDFKTGEIATNPGADGVFLHIRPLPPEKSNLIVKERGLMVTGEQQKELFMYCLCDWKGVVDQKGSVLKCAEDIKEKVFDFKLGGIPDFVILKSRDFADKKKDSEKN